MELRKTADHFGRIGVLMGGPSTERDISLKSGSAVYAALNNLGLDVVAIDITSDNRQVNIELINSKDIECAFLALHGRFGEDGQIQELLEELNILYTGSGVSASRLAMDKVSAHKIFSANGLNIPKYKVIEKTHGFDLGRDVFGCLGLPLVIKPASNGSSIGLSIINAEEDLGKAISLAFNYDNKIILEEYIKGRELTVGILGDRPLPVIEIITQHAFFDYEAKYKAGLTEYIVPACLENNIADSVMTRALSAHKLLNCFGCSRVDLILDKNNIPFILEVNTIPGMTATSLLPKAARATGLEFDQLCLKLIELAYEKKKNKIVSPLSA